MPKSKLRGGRKTHNKRIQYRTDKKEQSKKVLQKKFDELLAKEMELMQKQKELQLTATTENK